MNSERRFFPRIDLKIPVECRGPGIWQNAESSNISQGGIFVATDKIEPPGVALEIIFDFGRDEKQTIQVKAVVAWSRSNCQQTPEGKLLPAGMGIKFIKMLPYGADIFIGRQIAGWGDQ